MIRIVTQAILGLVMQAGSDVVFGAGFEDAQVGLMDVRSIYAQLGSTAIVGNGGITVTYPQACRSQPYVAGPNESAIIQVTASLQNALSQDAAYLFAALSENDGPMQKIGTMPMATSLTPAGNLGAVVRTPLNSGSSYIFGMGFSSNNGFQSDFVYCQGAIQVIKTVS